MVWTTVCGLLASAAVAAGTPAKAAAAPASAAPDAPLKLAHSYALPAEQTDADRYRSLGRITTQPGAATGRLVAETGEYLVMAPAHAGKPAQVLVYAVVPAH
jgi:hypothetical protein